MPKLYVHMHVKIVYVYVCEYMYTLSGGREKVRDSQEKNETKSKPVSQQKSA